jgi:hypothetical protein
MPAARPTSKSAETGSDAHSALDGARPSDIHPELRPPKSRPHCALHCVRFEKQPPLLPSGVYICSSSDRYIFPLSSVPIILAAGAYFSSASAIALCLTHAQARLYACARFIRVGKFLTIRGD